MEPRHICHLSWLHHNKSVSPSYLAFKISREYPLSSYLTTVLALSYSKMNVSIVIPNRQYLSFQFSLNINSGFKLFPTDIKLLWVVYIHFSHVQCFHFYSLLGLFRISSLIQFLTTSQQNCFFLFSHQNLKGIPS